MMLIIQFQSVVSDRVQQVLSFLFRQQSEASRGPQEDGSGAPQGGRDSGLGLLQELWNPSGTLTEQHGWEEHSSATDSKEMETFYPNGLQSSRLPPADGQRRPTILAEWTWTFPDAERELLQQQHMISEEIRHGLILSVTTVTAIPLSSTLNWKIWILVPVLPASNMMQYWLVAAANVGLWCLGGVQPATPCWGGRWPSSLVASRWRLTNVKYMSRNPTKMKTPASFGTFITTHSVLSFPVDRQKHISIRTNMA